MGLPVEPSDTPRYRVYANNSGVLVPSVTVAASKSGVIPGTMDSTPTPDEIAALKTALTFYSVDNVKAVDFLFSVLAPATHAVQAMLVRVGGPDTYDDDDALAAGTDCVIIPHNVPVRVVSDSVITRISFVGQPSGIGSAVYTGNRFYITGRV